MQPRMFEMLSWIVSRLLMLKSMETRNWHEHTSVRMSSRGMLTKSVRCNFMFSVNWRKIVAHLFRTYVDDFRYLKLFMCVLPMIMYLMEFADSHSISHTHLIVRQLALAIGDRHRQPPIRNRIPKSCDLHITVCVHTLGSSRSTNLFKAVHLYFIFTHLYRIDLDRWKNLF